MPSFKDAIGREFEAVITLSTAIKLQKIGINLNKPMDIPDVWNANLEALGNSIYLACEQSIKSHGLTDETFVEALSGDAITDATNAVWEAVILFSQPPIRAALRKMWNKGAEVTTLISQQMETAIDKATPEQILTSIEKRGNSQASQESHQTETEHSAN